ncbi:ADP-ribosylglycohydrolase family protein [Pseudoclavibacter chungangensis]|uniref:ADP-ribosylglycohydrolase family protein n=1 Tax=Pseudoclavibacter chungangensis TaxID=587635 RepID=A0A7J5BU99_9MICO|nr:ADP-ribosylglycohydrolase family protein [Pseudoclavibacter chungangensis]KAB1657881.1 ADP-ribosylglycohydrolase family protein [Pseudoclavibacter chungangensis]NYJ66514.1 ADP-ribosylglycohydrolase [Pseudoclavibacter chungangensis]
MSSLDPFRDRVAGVLLGQACGDALGVPDEFGPALPDSYTPRMTGGGPFGFDPGEYSDDTAMAVCIAEVSSRGADLTAAASLDEIAERFRAWAAGSKDVGAQISRVLARSANRPGPAGAAMLDASRAVAAANPGHVGNGALMRTAVVGLTRVADRDATAAAARAVAELTHADPLGLEAAVLWSEAVRLAVTEGRLDLESGLDLVPVSNRDAWADRIEEATDVDPRRYERNGYVVWALQAAWAACSWRPEPESDPTPRQRLVHGIERAVRAGDDTDTVAAIAGGLLGAVEGRSSVPDQWVDDIHGYGGHRADGLVRLALDTAEHGLDRSGER